MKIGDIVYISWGYDQTNINFYELIDKSGKMTFTLQEVGNKRVDEESGRGCNYVVPDLTYKYKEPFKKRLTKNGDFKIYPFAWTYLWDGNPKYQTASGYGH